jgi:hypothetical protein
VYLLLRGWIRFPEINKCLLQYLKYEDAMVGVVVGAGLSLFFIGMRGRAGGREE